MLTQHSYGKAKYNFIPSDEMENASDLDELTGKEVTNAFALHSLEHAWLEQVIFQVEEKYLVIAVDADYDEVIVSVLPALDFRLIDQQFSRTQISNQRKKISAIWRMTNQRGYEDGFQLEFDDVAQTNVQLLAEASSLVLTIFNKR
ncbi:DUF6334 family protein [Pontibacter rugosus]|uniref:DUF6334 family protein n=1 Tax=Pontibacter rugosus TaxID=1745966 RepID=A0ABW3SN99_9BACT